MNAEIMQVAARFSRAASIYGEHDTVQRMTARMLLDGMACQGGHWLDLGCGPGTAFSSFQPERVTALDIAPAMLKKLRIDFPTYSPICADAQNLPFKNRMFDAVYSNLALQWCEDLGAVARELKRVLRTGAKARLSLVAGNSLPQLSMLGLSRKKFAGVGEISHQFSSVDWQTLHVEQQELTCYFDDLRSLLYSLKGVGASMIATHRGLRGRQRWQQLQQTAESLRTARGIPLTYNIVLITACN
ncbi:methyltransferase domain-containing protein [Shewanella sp. A32]|uniref:methyltransferase domain-containing protein n=1 Tax=Shewanella sp. A32 TaxID=3031327 RepID=UPI0023B9F12F|nr:methyltransferase domain-containing protein [Shewanella sp. A32]MDF0534307.1 methyltransferase domain-containing protein [Shewanella sp. A32]